MTTPAFNSSTGSFEEVRLYTEFDPYHYITDNRPLQDLGVNSEKSADAADAGRSGVLISSLMSAAMDIGVLGSGTAVVGMAVSSPSVGVTAVAPGVLLSELPLNQGDSNEVLKRAVLPFGISLNTPHPATLGKEVTHLIQIRHRDFDDTTTFPYYLPDNVFSSSTMLNGWLEVAVLTGAEADTGLSVPPNATSGWTPLYTVLTVAGETSSTIQVSGLAPRIVTNLVEEAPQDGNVYVRKDRDWLEVVTEDQFDQSTQIASTAFVKGHGRSFSVSSEVSATGSVSLSDMGGLVRHTSGSASTLTLPSKVGVPQGASVTIQAVGAGVVTLLADGSDTITDNLGVTVPSIILNQGDSVEITLSGTSWLVSGGSYFLKKAGDFAAMASANGYQKLPSGVILQWATSASITAGGSGSVTFPIAFPGSCFFAISNTTASAGSATPSNIVTGTASTTAVPLYNLGTVAGVAKVFALGV